MESCVRNERSTRRARSETKRAPSQINKKGEIEWGKADKAIFRQSFVSAEAGDVRAPRRKNSEGTVIPRERTGARFVLEVSKGEGPRERARKKKQRGHAII